MSLKIVFQRIAVAGRISIAIAVVALLGARMAFAQSFSLLHSFSMTATDGAAPAGNVILDNNGNLFGTTYNGGANNDGTVFTSKADGTGLALLHSFSAAATDGALPPAGLTPDGTGFLYGVTQYGGADDSCTGGCGTVFKLRNDGTNFTLLHSFSIVNPTEGAEPLGNLVLDTNGNLFGTTFLGGPGCVTGDFSCGAVFTIKTDGTDFTILHAFQDDLTDGVQPEAGLVLDTAGNLYGTTSAGGEFGFGTVFTLRTDGGGYNLLYSFSDAVNDGAAPVAGLILDPGGKVLYGTTTGGGASGNCELGCGVVFSINTDGSGFKMLHSFTGGAIDGIGPAAALVLGDAGDLNGTTQYGGPVNFGTVFGLKTDGSDFTTFHTFLNSPTDGDQPYAALVLDSSGDLYGTTILGGSGGAGTIFKIAAGECQRIETTLSGDATICAGDSATIGVVISGGTPPLTVSLDNGGGTQTGTSPFTFHVAPSSTTTYALQSATSATGCPVTFSGTATVTVSPAIELSAAEITRPCAGQSTGRITIEASGGNGELSYSSDGGATFEAASSFAGLSAGPYNFVVRDSAGCSVTQALTLMDLPAIELSPTSVSSALQNAPYRPIAFDASGGSGAIQLVLTGNLPTGMKFEDGVLSGTPTATGNSTFTITATDANGCSLAITYTLTVGNPQQALAPLPGPGVASVTGR